MARPCIQRPSVNWNALPREQLCKIINAVELNFQTTDDEMDKSVDTGNVYDISPRTRTKIAKLVGSKCLINIVMGNVVEQVLWDTGAQVSLISQEWVKDHKLCHKIRPIEELFEQKLVIKSVSGDELHYLGLVDISVRPKQGGDTIQVPFLVTGTLLERPILGYNVIKHMQSDVQLIFQDKGKDIINSVADALSADESGDIAVARVGKQNVRIPSGETVVVKCVIHTGTVQGDHVALFVPADTGKCDEGLNVHETGVFR